MTYFGADVGARRLHVVPLDAQGHIEDGRVLAADDLESLVRVCQSAACVAIDAPDRLATAAHAADADIDRGSWRSRCIRRDHGAGRAAALTCEHDGGAIWLSAVL